MRVKSALVVIDMQNWSIDGNTRSIPKKLANFLDKNWAKFDYVIFTKSKNTKKSNIYKLLGIKDGMRGHQLEMCPEIRRFLEKGKVFSKTTYSAFKSKEFENFLKRNNINKLYLCGINTDKCVLATAYEAFDSGYDIRLFEDLIGSTASKAKHDAAMILLKSLVPEKNRYRMSDM